MALYNIYHGLGGSMGGLQYDYTAEFTSLEEAEKEAYDRAWEDYESYGGVGGLRDWAQVAEDYMEDEGLDCDVTELSESDLEDIDMLYTEEAEGWIEYKAILADKDEEISKDEREYM